MPAPTVSPTTEQTRIYECMLLLPTTIPEGERAQALGGIEELFREKGGKLLSKSEWGRRGLAYKIRGQTEGRYVVLLCELDPKDVREIDASLRLEKGVLRHLLVKVPANYEIIDYEARFHAWLKEREQREEKQAREREEETRRRIVKKAARKEQKEPAEEKVRMAAVEKVSLEEKLGKIISDEDLNL